jgi:nucleoside-diphosphate-sugar epimerase
MPTYLVTGAPVHRIALTKGSCAASHTIRVADNLSTGHRRNLAHLAGVELIEGDLSDMAFATRAVAGADYVLHQAAIPSVPRSVKDPSPQPRANIDGTLNVLVAARDAGVKRLVFAGSSDAATRRRCRNARTCRPARSRRTLQKVMGTECCRMFTRLCGFETVVIRYFSVFGPRQDRGSPCSGRHLALRHRAHRRTAADHLRRRRQTRDFTYVANVVDGVLRACEAPQAAGEAINVACGTASR